ncbi:MAG: hypothetical protein ACYTGH_09245 [Planctomycetota bacterium]|jgi:hypothetical protein
MEQAIAEKEDLVALFEESFRNIEASRLGETIMKLCDAISGTQEEVCCD